jgi:flagellar basal-body rod protein FlgC
LFAVDATKWRASASGPSAATIHSFAAAAFSFVSCVVKVFEATIAKDYPGIRIAASGLNDFNAETTRTPEGGPYRRKDTVFVSQPMAPSFSSLFESHLQEGVAVAEISVDPRDPERRYLPGHPDAGADGYVAFPRLNPAEDMVDLLSASRGYQANVAAMSAVKDMIHKSIDMLR